LEGFIDRLKLLRKKYNLSQKDFAKLIGSSQGNVGDWERGRSLPGAIAISRIVKQFNISADWLFFGMNEQDNQNNVESLIPLISKLNKDEIENVKKYTKFLIWLRNEKTEKNKQ
jgi:transcriptional regulator with XRE-family HTH domain